MNDPKPHIEPDDDIGPLDEHGQQIWSAEEQTASDRLDAEPGYLESLERINADIDVGHFYTQEEASAHMAEVRRRYLAQRGS